MKKILCVMMAMICALTLLGSAQARTPEPRPMRGLWVTTVANLDWPSRPGLTNAQMMAEADVILNRARQIGINTIFLQVRPEGDAIYNSAIFPWSRYLTGTQGQSPANGWSPLQHWIDGAHSRGMELRAWINPYRVTHATSNITDVSRLSPDNPARLNPRLARAHGRSMYLDPGLPEVRRLIIDGVVELLNNYNVDGIHFDDYFYPGRDFNDAATFAAHGAGWNNIHDWRRANVNALVRDTQQAIRATRPEVRFGISPFAIWQNRSPAQPLGSNTRGFESFHQIYSDSRRWVQEGWVDYIVPQIYWRIGFEVADFTTVLHWWRDVVDGTDVDLYIGMAAWRDARNEPGWHTEIWRQLRYSSQYNDVDGHVYFRAAYVMGRVGDHIWYFHRHMDA
ncbi:MAG: family 10 glycosylhydrolase [Oscillospiraceae bacterium]|nr:family 10 glycosylhydrolase [Oscillospiraceae bacterium]